MEKYTKAQMEVIEFENEDVITTSGTCNGVNASIKPWVCENDDPSHCSIFGEATCVGDAT